jgi:hypothetical protein
MLYLLGIPLNSRLYLILVLEIDHLTRRCGPNSPVTKIKQINKDKNKLIIVNTMIINQTALYDTRKKN